MVQEPTARYLRASWIRRTPKKPRPSAPASRTSSTPTSRLAGPATARCPWRMPSVDRRLAQKLRQRPARPVVADRIRRRWHVGTRAGDPRRGVREGRCPDWRRQRRSRFRWSATRSCTGVPRSRKHTSCRASSAARMSGARATRSPRWFRPRRAWLQGRPRRRRVGHQRSEDLDLCRPVRQLDLRVVPHRSRRSEASRHLVPPVPDGAARGRSVRSR